MNQSKIPIKKTCSACQGQGFMEIGQSFTLVEPIQPQLVEYSASEKEGSLSSGSIFINYPNYLWLLPLKSNYNAKPIHSNQTCRNLVFFSLNP